MRPFKFLEPAAQINTYVWGSLEQGSTIAQLLKHGLLTLAILLLPVTLTALLGISITVSLLRLKIFDPFKEKFVKALSPVLCWALAVIAALAKCLGYGYGSLLLLHLLFFGSISLGGGLFASSFAWVIFPCVAALGIAIIFISLGMEGLKLNKKIQPHAIDLLLAIVELPNNSAQTLKTELIHPPKSKPNTFQVWLGIIARFLYLDNAIRILGAAAKGCTMSAGTVGMTLVFLKIINVSVVVSLTGFHPIGWVILAVGIFFGIGAFAVSWGKEGGDWAKHVQEFGRDTVKEETVKLTLSQCNVLIRILTNAGDEKGLGDNDRQLPDNIDRSFLKDLPSTVRENPALAAYIPEDNTV